MPRATRQRREPTDDWQQLQLLTRFPEQLTYELIRPVVLFGHAPAERARQTGAPQRTLYRQVARFEQQGMTSLFPPAPPEPRQSLPPEIRQAIRELQGEYPSFRPNELATICATRFGRRPSPHTVKRILAEEPSLVGLRRRYPPYHHMAEAANRRLAAHHGLQDRRGVGALRLRHPCDRRHRSARRDRAPRSSQSSHSSGHRRRPGCGR